MVAPYVELAAPPIRLLTIEHAGTVLRYSSRPCNVLDGSTWRSYRGGLAESDVYIEAPIGGQAQTPSLPVEIIPGADFAALVEERHLLHEMRAEVSLWAEGTTFGQRRRIIEGSVSVDSSGYDGRPLRLTVTADDPARIVQTWPPATHAANDDTIGAGTLMRDQERGRTYPQVIGQAGTITVQGATTSVGATPVIPVLLERDSLIRNSPWGDVAAWLPGGWPSVTTPLPYGIVSAGWMYPGSGANQGKIRGAVVGSGSDTPAWSDCWLMYARDLLGQVITIVDTLVEWDAPSSTLDADKNYYAAIPDPCSGIARRDYRGGLEGAGEIARWALETSGRRIDWRRTGAALPALDRYVLGGFWDQSCDPWEWYTSNVAPIVPATWVPGPDGLYPVVWRLGETSEQADIRLIDGVNCTIEGEPKIEGARNLLSRVTLDYGNGLIQGQWRRQLVYHGRSEREIVTSVPTPHARRAQQRWGSQVGSQIQALEKTLTTDFIYRDEAAHAWLSWLTTLRSQPWRVFRVIASHTSPLARAEPGMVVAITSSRYSLSSRVAHVRRAGWLGGVCYADIVILSEP